MDEGFVQSMRDKGGMTPEELVECLGHRHFVCEGCTRFGEDGDCAKGHKVRVIPMITGANEYSHVRKYARGNIKPCPDWHGTEKVHEMSWDDYWSQGVCTH